MIIPSILSANFSRIADSIEIMIKEGADTFHVDIMDGHFVPNLTFGPELVRDLKREFRIMLDVHLMVSNPMDVISWFEKAGADWLSFHIEATPHAHKIIMEIKEKGRKAGIALNPSTPVELIYPLLDYLDFVLIMSVNPGFEGQKFIPSVLDKIKQLKNYINDKKNSNSEIQVDGGIGPDNLEMVLEAGASLIVAGSSIFRNSDPSARYRLLKEIEERFKGR